MKSLIGILFFASIIVEYYSYKAIKAIIQRKIFRRLWLCVSIGILFIILIWALNIDRNNKSQVQFLTALILLIYIPKLVLTLVLITEDLIRLIIFLFKRIFSVKKEEKIFLPQRRNAVSLLGLGLASIPFLSIIEGIVWGKFDFRVKKITLTFPDLPSNFDGYKIAQISDIHLGSFDIKDYEKVARGVGFINEENPDLFLFTGDSVNNYAEEMEPWISLFRKIKAKDGKYSVLGNHDYGIYVFGQDNITAQQENIEKIDHYHKELGWNLLRNELVKITKGDQNINIIGVENWGAGRFPKYGDLEKATTNVKEGEFNILMSHDPTHFDTKVKDFSKNIHLTLAGHTHGMQFGIEIPGVIKWSPSKYQYPKWAGLYTEKGKNLYVNRGFGFIGFSGRVGIWPEITIIELKKEKA